jgi:ADP-dependent NAD(P)H-hydrate dehydratase / NAD(P)H-hydrate epimerase
MTNKTQTHTYYTTRQVRELERRAIDIHHIPGFVLMQRAGDAAFNALRSQWPDVQQLLVFCGTGNNGGDGFVIAGLAKQAGIKVEVYLVGNHASIKGDALMALEFARKFKVPVHFGLQPPLPSSSHTVVVDALLGTGLAGYVRTDFLMAIDAINQSRLHVLAVDIPSGLSSDTGKVLGVCVKADLTVTFIGRKIGLVIGVGPMMCGKVVFDDLAVPAAVYDNIKGVAVSAGNGSA